MARSIAALLAASAALLPVAGCAASHAAAPDAAFTARATAVCRRQAVAVRAHEKPFPFASFNATSPDPSQLPAVASFYRAHDWQAALSVQRALHALPTPHAGEARWQAFLTQVDRYITTYRQQIAAAARADPKAFAATAEAFARMEPQVNAAATAAGVPGCSPFHLGS